jgi:hypothetical protein
LQYASADNTQDLVASATVYIWGAQMNRGSIPTPYLKTTTAARVGIPLSYDAAAAQYGILVEPAGTNIQLRSEEFDDAAWTKGSITVTANAATAPDGSTTADKLAESGTGSALHEVYPASPIGGNGANTLSVYMKAAELSWGAIRSNDGGVPLNTWFNLSNGTVGTNEHSTAAITSIGNGWYRCQVTRTMAGGAFYSGAFISNADNVSTYAGNGGDGIYAWGYQTETGSVVTSYIPTLGSTVTRAKDAVFNLTTTVPWSATAGTAYVDYKVLYPNSGAVTAHCFYLEGYPSDDERIIFENYTDNNVYPAALDGGAVQWNLTAGTWTQNTRHQLTHAWAANDIDASLDGAAIVSDGTATLPTITHFAYFTRTIVDGATTYHGMIYRLVYVPVQIETRDGDLEAWRYNF